MTTLLLKITCPTPEDEALVREIINDNLIEWVEEVRLPTNEDMCLEGDKYYMAIPKNQPKRNCDISFIRGANWLKSKILEP